MMTLEFLTLVLSIPLASLYDSTILINRIAAHILLSSSLILESVIYGRLFETSTLLFIYSLIFLSVFCYNYNLSSYILKNINLLSILAYIVVILTIFIIFFTDLLFNTYLYSY